MEEKTLNQSCFNVDNIKGRNIKECLSPILALDLSKDAS